MVSQGRDVKRLRRFRALCVVDNFAREALAVVVDISLSGVRVAREFDRLIEQRGGDLPQNFRAPQA